MRKKVLRSTARKSLIVSDLHLNACLSNQERRIGEWIHSQVVSTQTNELVLNGDVFDLSFFLSMKGMVGATEGLALIIEKQTTALREIVAADPQRIVILSGDHDHSYSTKMMKMIEEALAPVPVRFAEALYHEPTNTLVFHGHQLDYNHIPSKANGAALTDRLTEIFEGHVLGEDKSPDESVVSSSESEFFSFWYASGGLHEYLAALELIFERRRLHYYQKLSQLLRGAWFQEWRQLYDNPLNRLLASFARALGILGPRALALVGPLWSRVCGILFWKRAKDVLKNGIDRRILGIEFDHYPGNIVLGHYHKPRQVRLAGDRRICITVCPRWHAGGVNCKGLRLERPEAYVLLDADKGLRYNAKISEKVVALVRIKRVRAGTYGKKAT